MLRIMKCVIAGDWGSLEVHDQRTLTRMVLASLALALMLGFVSGASTCSRNVPLPDGVYTAGNATS